MPHNDPLSDEQFSPEERRRLREMERDYEHAQWLGRIIKLTAMYVSATIVGIVAVVEALPRLLKWFGLK